MKNLLLIVWTMVAMTVVSCQKNTSTEKEVPSKGGFSLKCYVPGSAINTYATVEAESGEEDVNALYVLFFRTDGAKDFIEFYDASPTDGQPINMSLPVQINFPAGSNLNNSTAYDILVVANLDNYIKGQYSSVDEWFESLSGKTIEEVVGTYKVMVFGAENNAQNDNSHAISTNDILMSAQAHKAADQTNVSVELLRSLSRFDISNIANGFELVSASVWNAYPVASIWQSDFNDFTNDRIKRYYGVQATNNTINGGLYAFENYVTRPVVNDQATTCIIAGIKNISSGLTTYYRVNINAKNFGQHLKRNNVYKMTIRRVLSDGANNEMDAYTSNETMLDIDINHWNMDDQGSIQYDGDNILAVPSTKITFTPKAETRTMDIFTLGTGTLEMSKSSLPAGITASLFGKTLTLSVTDSEETKEGFIELRFGRLVAIIDVQQTGATEQFLEVTHASLPMAPNTVNYGIPADIKVTSSGAWKAEIFNGGFTFTANQNVTVKEGDPGGTFTVATSNIANPNPDPRYAFILVTLKDNPDIARTIILSQAGSGEVIISSGSTALNFDADGGVILPAVNEYTINSGAQDWDVTIMGANASSFVVEEKTLSGFKITAKLNTESVSLTATAKVFLKDSPNVAKYITINQNHHSISLNPLTLANINALGGITPAITVTSTAAWKASIVNDVHTGASFENGTMSAAGTSGQTFKVKYDKLMTPKISPKATVTVWIENTNVKHSITVHQSQMVAKAINVVVARDTYDSFISTNADYRRRFDQIYNYLANPLFFGENGTVFSGSVTATGSLYGGVTTGALPTTSTNIYLHNNFDPGSNASVIQSWLYGADNRVVILTNQFPENYVSMVERTFGPDYKSATGLIGNGTNKYTPNASLDNKLVQYLLKDGPFTNGIAINPSSISLATDDAYASTLNQFPSTFIPIIMYPNNPSKVAMGIDPTRRIIYVGDPEMFGTSYASRNRLNWDNPNNVKFLQNVVAWMVNVTQYGDDFNAQFK